jgi:hypothetical protein
MLHVDLGGGRIELIALGSRQAISPWEQIVQFSSLPLTDAMNF